MTPDPEQDGPVSETPAGSPEMDTRLSSTPPLAWPPPGLGRVQGDAYLTARWLAGGAILVLPLLWAVVDRERWSLGPLGETLWLTAVLGIVGIPILLTGFAFLNRLLRRATDAARNGYSWRLIALTACDQRRDTGFLLQGARAFAVLEAQERRILATIRIWIGGLFLGAALWLSFGFALAVVLAARGALGPGGAVWLTLGPTLAAAAVAVVLLSWEETVLRRARKNWHRKPWSAELAAAEIAAWQSALTDREPAMAGLAEQEERAVGAFRVSSAASIVVGLVAVVPIFMLIFASMISPIMASIAVPKFSQSQERRAQIEPLRRYVLEPDPSVTAHEAGQLLHALGFAGTDDALAPGMQPPIRRHEEPMLPDPPEGTGLRDHMAAPSWFLDILADSVGALGPAAFAYLEQVAAHPGHADLARVARAADIDLATARWTRPLPQNMTLHTLPISRYAGLRLGAYAHLGKAALEARRGQYAAAETTLRELVSVGFLMADEGPTLIDNLIGAVLAGMGGDGLQRLYAATGRPEAEELRWARSAVERSVRIAGVGATSDIAATLRAMPRIATDTMAVPGLRWEMYFLMNTLSPCLNPHRIVFGPDPAYDAWMEQIRSGLVDSPGEAQLFELGRGGWISGVLGDDPGLRTRLITLTMGGVEREGSCGRAIAAALEAF